MDTIPQLPPERQVGAPGGVLLPVYGVTIPPNWTRTERVRLAVARALHAAAERIAGAACRVAPSWPR